MATPLTAARCDSPWTSTPVRGLGTRALAAVLATAVALLAACGQGGTGTGDSTGDGPGDSAGTGPAASAPARSTAAPTDPATSTPATTDPGATMDPSTDPAASAAALPVDPAGADLVLVAGPPGAEKPPVTLVCDWAAGTSSGTHPQAAQACADLLAAVTAGDPFAPVSPDAMCTQQYGGDAVVRVSGAVLGPDGAPVDVGATYTLADGCQIARFEAMGAVLAPFRGSV